MITQGMTPSEFIAAMNAGFTDAFPSHTPVSAIMDGSTMQTIINANFDKSDILVGVSASFFVSRINSNFAEKDTSLDGITNIDLLWVDDYNEITFDKSNGNQCEVWERVEDREYYLALTLNDDVELSQYKTWQNTSLKYRLRAKNGNKYSAFSEEKDITTPWVFYTDQTTPERITINRIISYDGLGGFGENTINWGDGDSDVYSGAAEDAIFHDYESGQYFIQIYGAPIEHFEFFEQKLDGTDITKWKINNVFTHFYNNGFVGDITNWLWEDGVAGLHFWGNPISGDLNGLFAISPSAWYDCHMELGVNATSYDIPPKMAHLVLRNVTGDISHWRFPKNTDYKSWMLDLTGTIIGDVSQLFNDHEYLTHIRLPMLGLTGDLSGWNIIGSYFATVGTVSVRLNGNQFTKLPRGNFYRFAEYNCADNLCDSDEIDAILADIDASVTANAPLYNCVYTINGLGMGTPTAAGLASKASIEAKYEAAEKTISILVNS